MKPKVEFHDSINDTTATIKVGDFAKLLTKKGFKIGPIKLFEWLRDNKILMDGRNKNKPYQVYMDKGYFEIKESNIKTKESEFISYTPLITGKGQIYLEKRLREEIKSKQAI
jgi:anti-repressor protein